ncbi:MAG: hypothetical protein ACK41E_09325, partial [Deinococcales bacterium]
MNRSGVLIVISAILFGSFALAAPTELSAGQFGLVYQLFSITIASMGAAFIFLVLGKQNHWVKYQPAMLGYSLVFAVAIYKYIPIINC